MESLSRLALDGYRGLVYEDAEFIDYFRQATPIDQIAGLHIGSRPARAPVERPHRGPARHPLGLQLDAESPRSPRLVRPRHRPSSRAADAGAGELAAMYRRWPFFRSLIDNAQLSIGKADLAVARLYAGLVDDGGLRQRIFGADRGRVGAHGAVRARCHGADGAAGELAGAAPLDLAAQPLRRPIELSTSQRAATATSDGRRRAGPPPVQRLVALTINGVAAGLQNTG